MTQRVPEKKTALLTEEERNPREREREMGTGWRRAFCTSIPRDPENPVSPEKHHHLRRDLRQQLSPSSSPSNQTRSPINCAKFAGVFSAGGSSNPSSSVRLRCRTSSDPPLLSPAFDGESTDECTAPPSSASAKNSPRLLLQSSKPSSPRSSPSRFALLKATLRLSRSRCGICSQSVRSCQKTPVFTAECSHSFHFPCISAHVRTQTGSKPGSNLACPVCSAAWREVPLLSSVNPSPPPQLPPFLDAKINRSSKSGENNVKQETSSKIYDDDEPLQISSAGQGVGALHFNPIPEAELEDEVEGGNGYARIKPEEGDYGVEVAVMPEAAPMVSADRNHQNYVVLLRVKAPDLPQRSVSKVAASVLDPSCRAPIDLVTVLDVSGSMTVAKLQMLKRAMRLLISSLGNSDRLSIVAFSAESKRLLPLVRMSRQGQRSARQIVDRLIVSGDGGRDNGGVSGESRCIGHALRKATKVLEDRRQRNPVATIMLLSDSPQEHPRFQEDDGVEKEAVHHRTPIPPSSSSSTEAVATRFAHLEIPIGCSSELAGGGVNPRVEDVFSKCVSGLVSVVLQDVHLQLTFPPGSVCAIYSYAAAAEGSVSPAVSQVDGISVSVNLGDFYAAEKRELLVELRLPSGPQRHCLSLSYKCCYQNPTTRRRILCRERSLLLPPLRQTSPPASALELRNLFITTRALVESKRLAELNDLDTAAHLLTTARSLLLQSKPSSYHHSRLISGIESRLSDLHRRQRRRRPQPSISSSSTPRSDQLTPTSAWRAAEQLAKVAILRKSLSRVGDLHGFENARF